ncbi:MAG: phosphoribosylformylglycinamidine synthase [Proteobacteria bacterium]|nr:phosphoribosylformylglycinamidine synthase [Pseudomonadota bacterium]
MISRLEITLKKELADAEGRTLLHRAQDYFGMALDDVRTVNIITIEAALTKDQLAIIQSDVFSNPVTQISSYDPLPVDFDWCIWVGYRPGVRDNPGSTAVEAIEDILGIRFGKGDAVYTSKRYCIKATGFSAAEMNRIAGELVANDIIQQWKIYDRKDWQPKEGTGFICPKVVLNHTPTVLPVTIESDDALKKISDERNLALNPNDIPVIRSYFLREDVLKERKTVALSDPTDIELEYISQARSDHCNHNTFRGLFRYQDDVSSPVIVEDNLFKTYIQKPTLELKDKLDWVVSVLWDNAGIGRFDENHNYSITGETHNSPSNMEAYGGSITGIVGVYRDPMGTGLGSRLVMGSYGFCTGFRNYNGDLKPRLHPRRLLDGIIEGVKDGGNKSGIPTPFGQVYFHDGYMGKCLVFVTAVGIIPSLVNGQPSENKKTSPEDLIVMSGGRVGKDGIHGVTASSEVFSEHTPAGHVQIGDPYTQKKMHDFILEARDECLIEFITDNGGGGLSSSVGESSQISNGCIVDLEKVPLKYDGLDQWEIWVSESQERMTLAVKPENIDRFLALSKKHAVESTVIGKYTNSGKLHIKYNGTTCAYVNMDLLSSGFPQWTFDAVWEAPEKRGLREPVFNEPKDFNQLMLDMLSRPNISSKEWIARQYDHEVQGGSVVKPLVGKERNTASDAAVIRPVLDSEKGLAFSQSLLPSYSRIDAYHMTCATIDEAVRRVIAVGGNPGHIGGVDNFCWPDIKYHPEKNPDGKFKAAQLVRSCQALKDTCMAYSLPLLSGKDSMYVDGYLPGRYGETRKISALETMQFSVISLVEDIKTCVTMDAKLPGDLVYVLGMTRDELGASEYYDHLGFTGKNVPEVCFEPFLTSYRALHRAIEKNLVASAHGIYRGGLGIHLSMVAMGGHLGMTIDLEKIPVDHVIRSDKILFSESPGRFIVTVSPDNQPVFEKLFKGLPCARVGRVTETNSLIIKGIQAETIVNITVNDLKVAWKRPFGDLI